MLDRQRWVVGRPLMPLKAVRRRTGSFWMIVGLGSEFSSSSSSSSSSSLYLRQRYLK